MTAAAQRLSVLLATEGTYPHHKGDVSTWCHALTSEANDVDFTIFALATHPYMGRAYQLPSNVRQLISVPLWGTEDPAEYGRYRSAEEFLRTRWQTTSDIVAAQFVPVYACLLREAMTTPPSLVSAADAIVALHRYFGRFDYHRTMTDRLAWNAFVDVARDGWRRAEPALSPPSLGELADAWRLLGRLLTPLSMPIPRTDVTHSTAAAFAAFCGLPCLVAKLRWGTPFLLTEHGVYVREPDLNLGRVIRSPFVRWFTLRVIGIVADLNYAYADELSPVCRYNTHWERWRGAPAGRIRVIYNGVDPARFSLADGAVHNPRLRIVSVGPIVPLQGQLDLIEAAALVRHVVPDVEVLLYGPTSDRDYCAECEARVCSLGLEETVIFAGATTQPSDAYRSADIVAMSSISEAVPYAVIEAMLSGAAIVATDVGGVNEALGPAGALVPSRNPPALAAALIALLEAPAERRRLGAAARARGLEFFTEDTFVDEYRATYLRLAGGRADVDAPPEPALVTPFLERRAARLRSGSTWESIP